MATDLTPEELQQAMGYPIQQPPPGVKPNFVNPDSTAYQVYITAAICIPLMLAFASTRFISKFALGNKILVSEEVVFALGLILCLLCIGINIACVAGGAFGKDAWNVLLGAFTRPQLILALLAETFLPIAICSVKVSVLLLYHHVFWIHEWMRVVCITTIILVTAWHLSLTIAFAVMCSPHSGHSQLDFLSAFISNSCTKTRILVVLQGAGNVITDIFLFVLPLPAVWSLHMRMKRKIAVSFMFLVGLCACASSIAGLYYRVRFYTAGSNNIRLVVPVWATAMAEEAAGILICCMPATAFFFKAAREPAWAWLSATASRATHFVTPSHSSIGHIFTKRSVRLPENLQDSGSQECVYVYPESSDDHAAWNEPRNNDLSLEQMDSVKGK